MGKSQLKYLINIIVYTILPKLPTISFFFILPFVSKYLTLDDYAVFGLVSAYLLVFQFLVISGQNVLLQNSFFELKHKFHLVWSRSFGLMTLSALVSASILTLILFLTLKNELGANFKLTVSCLSLFLILSPIDTVASTFFVLKERPLIYSLISLLNGAVSVSVFYYVVKVCKMGYMGWMIMWPSGALVSYVLYTIILYREFRIYPKLVSSFRFKSNALKKGLPLVPHQLSLMLLSSSDRLLLQFYGVPSKSIGLYSQGYTIGAYGLYFVNGFFQAFARKLQEVFRNSHEEASRRFLKEIIFISSILISLLLFVFSLFTKDFFLLMFQKEDLQNGYSIAYIVLCSYMFWTLYSYFTYPLLIFNKTKEVFYISGTAAIFNVIGNIIFIPFYGIYSALFMTYASMVVFGIVGLLNRSNRAFFSNILNLKKYIFFISLLNIILLLVASISIDLSIVFKLLIIVICLLMSYIAIKQIKNNPKLETSFL